MLTNNIINNEEEKPISPTYPKKRMIETHDEKETTPTTTECAKDKMVDTNEEEQTTPWATPRSKLGSNDTWTQHLPKYLFRALHLEQNPTMPLKFTIIGTKKPCKQ